MKKLANTFLVLSSGLIFTGILFKKMHWPGASISLILGSSLSLLGMLFYFIVRYRNKHDVKVATYSVYFYFFVMVVGTGFYSAMSASKDLLNGFHDVNVQIENSNKSLINLIEKAEGISPNGRNVLSKIDNAKKYLISGGLSYGNESYELLRQGFCDARGIPLNKDNQDIAAQYFLTHPEGKELENLLVVLRGEYVRSLGESHPSLFDPIEGYLNWDGTVSPWVNNLSEHLPMISVLSKLTLIQNQILNCELALQNKGL